MRSSQNRLFSRRTAVGYPENKCHYCSVIYSATLENKLNVDEEGLQAFKEAGYSKQNILEINLIIALKTFSNYTNHLPKIRLMKFLSEEAGVSSGLTF